MHRWGSTLLGWLQLFVVSAASLDDQFHVQHWTVENGLPQNTVQCLLQTRDGFLWIGTRSGLARYDGREFRRFDRTNTPELKSDGILCLAEAADGTLWIGTSFGVVSVRDGRWSRFEHSGGLQENRIFSIAPCRDGGVWVGADYGLFHLLDGSWELWHRESPVGWNASIFNLIESPDGSVWLGDVFGLLEWPRGRGEIHYCVRLGSGLKWEAVNSLAAGAAGELWFSNSSQLCRWYDETLDQWPHPKGGWVPPLAVRAEGGVWLALPDLGLGWFDQGEFNFFGAPDGIRMESYNCLLADRDGCLWLGTESQGLFRFRPRQFVTYTTANGLTHDDVWSISEGPDGTVWVGTRSGASRWNSGRWEQFRRLLLDGSSPPLRMFSASSGEVYSGITHLSLWAEGKLKPFYLSPATNDPNAIPMLPSCYSEGRNGTLLFGIGSSLLVRFGTHWFSIPLEPPHSQASISSILEDASGDIWIGFTRGRVDRLRRRPNFDLLSLQAGVERDPASWTNWLDREIFTTRDGLVDGPVGPVLAEPDGRVWFGSGRGLVCWKDGRFRRLDTAQGLPEPVVLNVLADDHGWYWLNGHQGLHRVRQDELRAVADGRLPRAEFISYGEADGMLSAEGNGGSIPNSCKTRDGRLWFPTTRGVVVVDPARLDDGRAPPPAVIDEVFVDDQPLSQPTAVSHQLAPGRARSLEVRFSVPDPAGVHKVRTQYRLNGHDPGWRDDRGNRRLAVYTNLRPGPYHFEVRTLAAASGESASPVAAFAFRLAPHFWQTWPFYAACGLAVLGGGWGLHRLRLRRQMALERLEAELALARQRERIARDLHDELGAGLTRLALLSGRAPAAGSPGDDLANDVTASARELSTRLGEVVWATDPRHDRLDQLAAHLREYAARFLADAGLEARLDFPESPPLRPLNTDRRRDLFLMLKEALNNVVKHAQARSVTVRFTVDAADVATLEIADDGCGLAPDRLVPCPVPASNSSGHGLRHLRERAAAAGGECSIDFTAGQGTTVRVKMLLPRQ